MARERGAAAELVGTTGAVAAPVPLEQAAVMMVVPAMSATTAIARLGRWLVLTTTA